MGHVLMAEEAFLEQKIEAPVKRMAELVRTACGEHGWRIENIWLNQLTANQRRTQRMGGLSASYEYRMIVKWGEILPDKLSYLQARVSEQEDRVSEDTLSELAMNVLESVIEKASDLEEVEAATKPSEAYGSARWAEIEDLEKAGYIVDRPERGRLIIGPVGDGRLISVDRAGTLKHALMIGPTGSGKSSKVIKAQAILRLEESMIITEATPGNQPPDVYSTTATWRARMGQQKIFYFNPDDLHSNQINPLDQVTTFEKAQDLASLIMDNTGRRQAGGDPMWENSERHLLTALLIYAKGEKGHLGMVRNLMREGPDGVGRLINKGVYLEAINEYKLFVKNSTEGIRNGVASGLMQRLNLWVNPKIVKLTEKTDFDVSDLLRDKFTFYLAVPAHKRLVKPLAALVFNFLLNILLEHKPAHPVSLVLDEFTNFGRIDGIEDLISIIRQRDIPILFGCQNFLQLKKVYGLDDAGILYSQTSSKFIFRAQDLDTAKKVSESLGRKTVVERKMSSSGHLTEREFGRPLMETDELMNLQDSLIVFTPNTPPLRTKGFTWQDFTYATNLPAYDRRLLEIDDRLTEVCAQAAIKPEWVEEVKFTYPEDAAEPKEEPKDEPIPEPTEAKEEPKKKRSKLRPFERERANTVPVSESVPEPVTEPIVEPDAEETQETEPEDEAPDY
jgi:type IV secretory pathway TraG/TraD family ATPase VirD4